MSLKSYINKLQLNYFSTKIKIWCNTVFATLKHLHVGSEVTLTGYAKANSKTAIVASDTVNSSIGKLEYKVDSYDDSNYVHKSTDETIAGIKTFNSTISGSINGNSATATKLSTARKIDAASFDGSVNIVVVPVGTIVYYGGTGTPANYLLCNGGAVSRTTYSTLYSIIGTKYGSGDGSTTFNLPNLIDKFPQGNATPGTMISAGLPNITGTGGAYLTSKEGESIYVSSNGSDAVIGSGHITRYFKFDASRSSSIYGNSTTVQPPALTLRPLIKYA